MPLNPLTHMENKQAEALSALYGRMVESGSIRDDAAQREVLAALQSLADGLAPPAEGGLKRLFKKQVVNLRGLYIWGKVGRGKSMLMDLFFDHVAVAKKRRVHFHAFMQEVHARIHKLRLDKMGDPVAVLAKQLAEESTLLCFDELQATDVADATLLFRLFSGLFEAGVVIVSTSNRPPAELYTGGVQRERFAKFIELIESRMDVMSLPSPDDYRMKREKSVEQVYFSPLGKAADQFVKDTLARLAGGAAARKETLEVHGRQLSFIAYPPATGLFTFHELCELPLGAGDYLAIANHLKTVFITGIPLLDSSRRNEAKRFVTLVDALYEHKVKTIFTAAVAPAGIYSGGDGGFEFRRTVSRLMEMQSAHYLYPL